MVDSREAEVNLMVKVVDLKVLYKIKVNLNGRMMTKVRPNGKVVILTEEVLDLIEEEVIPILEVDFMVIISDVVKRDIDLLNLDLPKVGRIIKKKLIHEDIENSPSGPKAQENLMVKRTLRNKGSDE